MKKLGGTFLVIVIAAALIPWAMPTANAGSNDSLGSTGDVTITLQAGQYEIDEIDEYSVIEMEGFGRIINPGEPTLPSKTFLVGLPAGAEAVSVDMDASDYEELHGEYRILPAPPIISGQEDEKVKWGENEKIYSLENAYPSSVYEYLGMGQMRKYNFARVRFCPVAYYPASNRLGLYRSITLKIKYEIRQAVSPELLSDTVMDDVASQIIFNYASIKSRYQPAIAPSAISYDYMIITTELLQSAVEPLVTWKTTMGYSVNVVTTNWISSNYSGRDLPEKIRNFLIDKYAEWGIEYVLIVGSHSTIPMRYCYPDPSDHDPNSDSMTPTDYYYADLNGDWDSDGDGYFGEYGQDNVGYHPEVYVGRIPFDDSAVVMNICQKLVNFEQDSGAWKKKALLLGPIVNYGGEDHLWFFPRTDDAVLMEECWNDILKDNGYSRERMYEKEGLSPSTYACEHPLTNPNVLNPSYGWPSGYGIVNWGGHGNHTAVYRKVWQWDDGDGVPEPGEVVSSYFIGSHHASLLNDSKPAIVFSNSCLTAYPENPNNLGNSLLQQGAVAFVGATRTAWYATGWSNENSGASSSIDYYFFHYLINKSQKCGDALYNAQVRVYDHYWFTSWEDWQNMFAFCLYGDPSLGTASRPPLPHMFYGSLTIDGEPAPVGTKVESRGANVITGISGNPMWTTDVGNYGTATESKLYVQGPHILNGDVIEFYVNGVKADQTYPFTAGAITELDLSVTVPGIRTLTPEIALNVKGAIERFTALTNLEDPSTVGYDWTTLPGINLGPEDIYTVNGGTITDDYIDVQSAKPGDCHVRVQLKVDDELIGEYLTAEKKWGVIEETELDLDPDTSGIQTYIIARAGDQETPDVEVFRDTINAWFYWGEEDIAVYPAGHAVVHWWLFDKDSLRTAGLLDDLEALVGCDPYAPAPALTPFEQIDALHTGNEADFTSFTKVDGTGNIRHNTINGPDEDPTTGDPWPADPNVDATFYIFPETPTYLKTMTICDAVATVSNPRGSVDVEVTNEGGESVVIISYTEYPADYHDQNPVCVEYGEKEYIPCIPPPGSWSFTAAGFFPKHLPDAYTVEVVLADLDLADIPDEVQGVWWWDSTQWIFWIPGVGGDLTTLRGQFQDYMVLVSGPCDWTIPLADGFVPEPVPESYTWGATAPGFFPKHLPDAYTGEVVLADLDAAEIPDCIQGVWYYDGNAGEYIFWIPGVGGELTTLKGGLEADYSILVSGACAWTILLP